MTVLPSIQPRNRPFQEVATNVMGSIERPDDPRAALLLGLYTTGVLSFETAHQWAVELGLTRPERERLLQKCVQAHFAAPDDRLAA
jgi:hypothetical protein